MLLLDIYWHAMKNVSFVALLTSRALLSRRWFQARSSLDLLLKSFEVAYTVVDLGETDTGCRTNSVTTQLTKQKGLLLFAVQYVPICNVGGISNKKIYIRL